MNSVYQFRFVSGDTVFDSSSDEIRIISVVEGSCRVQYGEEVSILKRTDLVLINPLTEAVLTTQDGVLAAVLRIPYYELTGIMGRIAQFSLDSTKDSGRQMVETQHLFRGLLMCFVGDREKNRLQETGLYYLLLQKLVTDFALERDSAGADEGQDQLALEILEEIWLNFRQEVSLTEIAEKRYLSRSTVSRMLKRYTGMNFPDYLKSLRLRAVKSDLERTDKSITDIALDCGFSSSSVLNRTFRESFGITPGQYREQAQERVDISEITFRDIKEILEAEEQLHIPEGETVYSVPVNLSEAENYDFWKNRLLNAGSMSMLFNAKVQNQLLFLQERLNIEYLRVWNPFSLSMMSYDEEKRDYNFSFIDDALDFCADHHFKVFLDLAPRRERNMANERREITGSSNMHRFGSLDEWLQALHALISHLRTRYDEEIVRDWIFELTFYLNDIPYHEGKDYSAAQVFDESYEVIKSLIPEAQVAGPGLIAVIQEGAVEDNVRRMFRECRNRPDIFTSIHFPYFTGRNMWSSSYTKNPTRNYFGMETGKIREALSGEGFTGEYWVTEFGVSISNRNFLQDSCYRGTEILETILRNQGAIDSFGIFYASDLLGAFRDSGSVLSGSGGILSRDGIRKPAYYAFRFLRQLGTRKICMTDHLAASCSRPDDVSILCWNAKYLGPKYYMNEEDSVQARQVDDFLEDTEACLMEVLVQDLEPGVEYRIRQRVLNSRTGSVLNKWIQLGASNNLTRDDMEYLSQISVPEVLSEKRKSTDGKLRISFRLEANEMRMIHITKA